MKIIRFILPFLFVRNWHDGSWELSKNRLYIFISTIVIIALALLIAYVMQSPVLYRVAT